MSSAALSVEQRIESRIDKRTTQDLVVSTAAGGLAFANMSEVLEFAKAMAVSGVAVPKHLRNQPGACLGVVMQAIAWRMEPFAVANKSYSVNDRLAFEAQLIAAVVLSRAPIAGRPKYEFTGDGPDLRCTVSVKMADGETLTYTSPRVGDIPVKNSPLWKGDPQQQLGFYTIRAWARRHVPDVILGVYADDEVPVAPLRDVTPPRPPSSLSAQLDALAAVKQEPTDIVDPETGEIHPAAEQEGQPAEAEAASEPERPAPPLPSPETYIAFAEGVIERAESAKQLEEWWRSKAQREQRAKLISVDEANALKAKADAKIAALKAREAGDA